MPFIPYTGEEITESIRKTLTPYIISAYIAIGAEIASNLTTPGTPIKYSLPLTPKSINGFIVDDLGGGNTRLRKTADDIQKFKLSLTSSILASVSNVDVFWYIYKNGVFSVGGTIERKIAAANDKGAIPIGDTMDLDKDDYVELFIDSSSACYVTLLRTNITFLEIN